jgi:predicted XRE-type DNA-binding protein
MNNLQIMSSEISLEPKSAYAARYGSSYGNFLDLHDALIEHREATGLTQAKVAQNQGISQPAVSNFEGSNSSAVMISTLISYAAAVGLEIEFNVKKTDYPDLPQA